MKIMYAFGVFSGITQQNPEHREARRSSESQRTLLQRHQEDVSGGRGFLHFYKQHVLKILQIAWHGIKKIIFYIQNYSPAYVCDSLAAHLSAYDERPLSLSHKVIPVIH